MPTGDDKYLFDAIRRDDKKAYETVFRQYYKPLTSYAFRFLGEISAAENMVQDVFLRLWQKRHEIMITSSMQNYLFRSVKNHCLNFLDHEKIKSGYCKLVIVRESDRNDYGEFFPEIGLLNKIEIAIASLPDRRQEIFRLAREEGLKYREIAERLGLSVKTVEAQMTLALKYLRDALKEYKSVVLFFLFRSKGI
jgi:RNA polymerase sigma-70 factor (ECF subfamily)